MTSSNTGLESAFSSLSLTAASAASTESSSSSSSSSATKSTGCKVTPLIERLQGRDVYKTNAFSDWFRDALSGFTGLSRDFCFLIESYMIDGEFLERICYPAPNLPDQISLSDVFMKTIPLPFVPAGKPNPKASKMLRGVACGSMQNLVSVDLGGVLMSFATGMAGRDDVAERIHAHMGKFITEFAPRLQRLTLQLDFRVAASSQAFDWTQYQFNADLLKKYLLKHASVETMTITLVSAPMKKFVVLDLTNRRLHSETTMQISPGQ